MLVELFLKDLRTIVYKCNHFRLSTLKVVCILDMIETFDLSMTGNMEK